MGTGVGASLNDGQAQALRAALLAGQVPEFDVARSPVDGLASVFQMWAEALADEQNTQITLFYTRLALHLSPDMAAAALLAGEVLGMQGQYDLAVQAYGLVPPDDPMAISAAVGQANAESRSGQGDAAVARLQALAGANPDHVDIALALADMLRREARFAEAEQAYSRALALLGDADRAGTWRLYFARGIARFQTDDWPGAEADFRQSLALDPDQADVLNYLGYSLVERRENLDEALEMIERAARITPNSGYIIDSLAWVYYRLGRYEDAVAPMARAVSLMPDDPILNDHYGDILWMVGRKREARFQWRRALSFGPEEDEFDRIRRKLDLGLDQVLAEEAAEAEDADRAAPDASR